MQTIVKRSFNVRHPQRLIIAWLAVLTLALAGCDAFMLMFAKSPTPPSTPPNHVLHAGKATVSTLAGGPPGAADGKGSEARFNAPRGVAVDASGSLYVADTGNHLIRKVTPEGLVTTLAGSTQGRNDGTGTAAQFNAPTGIAVDSVGTLFVTDTGNHLIRQVTPDGVVSTLAGSTQGTADGAGTAAQFDAPTGIAVDSAGNLYVADSNAGLIRRLTPQGAVSTLIGTPEGGAKGTLANVRLDKPNGLAVDTSGNLYVDGASHTVIQRITPQGGVTEVAGQRGKVAGQVDGTPTEALFKGIAGLAVDRAGRLYVTETGNEYRLYFGEDIGSHAVRLIQPGGVSTLAGKERGLADGSESVARFSAPMGIALDDTGLAYVADTGNHRIRAIRLP